MSKFIDKLNQLRKVEPQPMGFAVSKPSAAKQRLPLIAHFKADDMDTISAGLGSADAALIDIAKVDDIKALEKICETKDSVPGGGWLKSMNAKTIQKFLDVACDFVTFSDNATLSVTQKEKMGRVLEIDASLSDVLLRTANDLPIDAVMVMDNWEDGPLTLNRLMEIRRLVYLIGKPILILIPNDLSGAELQSLWDMGVSGIIVELNDQSSVEKLVELRKATEKLNPPSLHKKEKMSATLPRMQLETPAHPEEEEEEEEDE